MKSHFSNLRTAGESIQLNDVTQEEFGGRRG